MPQKKKTRKKSWVGVKPKNFNHSIRGGKRNVVFLKDKKGREITGLLLDQGMKKRQKESRGKRRPRKKPKKIEPASPVIMRTQNKGEANPPGWGTAPPLNTKKEGPSRCVKRNNGRALEA